MRCSTSQKLIHDLVDGTLAESQMSKLMSHINCCPGCRSLLHISQELSLVASRLPQYKASAQLWPRIAAEIDETSRASLWSSLPLGWEFFKLLSYGIATVVMLTCGILFWTHQSSDRQGAAKMTYTKVVKAPAEERNVLELYLVEHARFGSEVDLSELAAGTPFGFKIELTGGQFDQTNDY